MKLNKELISILLGIVLLTSVLATTNPIRSQDNNTIESNIIESLDISDREIPDEYSDQVDKVINDLGTSIDAIPGLNNTKQLNNTYRFIELDLNLPDILPIDIGPGDIPANITFNVEKEWIQNITGEPADVVLRRYNNGEWNNLETLMINETDTDYRFEAETPGFSYFSIGLKEEENQAPDNIIESLEIPDNYSNVNETISELGNSTDAVPEVNNTYQYIEIDLDLPDSLPIDIGPGDIPANITFNVEKEWIQNITGEPADVVLRRYNNGEWNNLETLMINETDTDYRFEAETPGFSYFSIGLEQTEKTIEEAIAGDDGEVGDIDILDAIDYWSNNVEVPGVGKVISDFKILELIDMWSSG